MEQIASKRTGRGRRFVAAFLLAGAVAAVPAVSEGASFIVKATGDETWRPARLTVAKGSKVVWKNPTSRTHNVVAYRGKWSKSSTLAPGSQTAFTFKNSGTYKYRCTLHSDLNDGVCEGMCGKVRVN